MLLSSGCGGAHFLSIAELTLGVLGVSDILEAKIINFVRESSQYEVAFEAE